MKRRRLLLAVTGWTATAAIATGAGIAVIGLLGQPLAGGSGDVLSAEEAGQALARAAASPRPSSLAPSSLPPSTPPTGGPSAFPDETATPTAPSTETSTQEATPGPVTTPMSKVITTRGGSVVARCDGRRVTLRSWSPAQGYEVDDVDPGPESKAKVTFERDNDEVEIEIRCTESGPVHTVEYD